LSGQFSFSYKQQKEEAADEEEEKKEEKEEEERKRIWGKEEPKVEWILKQISALEMEQIGSYRKGNMDFAELIKSIHKIQTNHAELSDGVKPILELLGTQNIETVFTHLQGIYKFIIHMHNRYGVQLKANTSVSKDWKLVNRMQTTFCKYTIFVPHLLNHLLTSIFVW
jgi:hypothetical protein